MAVVYLHKKADTKEVFYVGIGACRDRAYLMKGRNSDWELVRKQHGVDVEIIHEGIAMESARQIERSLITKYGRLDKGTGCLVNKSKGGDGVGYGPIKYTNYGNTKSRDIYTIIHNESGRKYSTVKNASFLTGISIGWIKVELMKLNGKFSYITKEY